MIHFWPIFSLLTLPLAISSLSPDQMPDFMKKAKEKGKATVEEYESNFLVTQTALTVEKSFANTLTALQATFQSGKAETEEPDKALKLLKTLNNATLLEELSKCSHKECSQKLHDTEKLILTHAQDKWKTFEGFIETRLKNYLAAKDLVGYEERLSQNEIFPQLLAQLSSFKIFFPQCFAYFEKQFLRGEKPSQCTFTRFLREEIVLLPSSRIQPIYRLSQVVFSKAPEQALYLEVPVYTNHYFDSSLRAVEAYLLSPEKTLLVISDIMEIDELKKSGLIRFLYKGQMQQAVLDYQLEELNKLQ